MGSLGNSPCGRRWHGSVRCGMMVGVMGEQLTKTPVDEEPARYCRGCGYNLRGLTVPRCPECGRPFDPADPHTYREHPIRRWVRPRHAGGHLRVHYRPPPRRHVGLALLGLVFRTAGLPLSKHTRVMSRPSRSPLAPTPRRPHRIRPGSRHLALSRPTRKDITDFKSLAQLTHLRHLDLYGDGITDLAPIAGLTKLEHLGLARTPATVLSPPRRAHPPQSS